MSLPSDWAEAEELSKGDVVTVHTYENGIVRLQAEEPVEDSTVRIPVYAHTDPGKLSALAEAAYTCGYREVHIDGESPLSHGQRRAVRQTVRELTGTNIVDESDSTLHIRKTTNTKEIAVVQLVRQAKFLALSNYRDAITAVATQNADDIGSGLSAQQVGRLDAMISRTFRRALTRLDEMDALGRTRPELFDLWIAGQTLNRIVGFSTELGQIARAVDGQEVRELNELQGVAEEVCNVVEQAVDVLTGDANGCSIRGRRDVHGLLAERLSELDAQFSDSAEDDYQIGRTFEIVRQTAHCAERLTGAGLRTALRREELYEIDDVDHCSLDGVV